MNVHRGRTFSRVAIELSSPLWHHQKFVSYGYTTNPTPFFVLGSVLCLFLGHTQCIVQDSSCEEETRVNLMWTETVCYDWTSCGFLYPNSSSVPMCFPTLHGPKIVPLLSTKHTAPPAPCLAQPLHSSLFQCRLILHLHCQSRLFKTQKWDAHSLSVLLKILARWLYKCKEIKW